MTVLQSLLGRRYKWLYLLGYQIKASTTYRTSAIIWMIVKLIVIFSTILVWKVNIDNGSKLFEFKEVLTYYIVGSIIALSNGVHWNVSDRIMKGTLSKYLIVPSNVMARYILEDIGWWLFQNTIEVISLILIAIFFAGNIILSTPILILNYIICAIIGYIISIFFSYILGSMAFFLTDAHGILDLQSQSNYFLSGKAIPLNSTPGLKILTILPFSYTFYHPIQIYLGKYNDAQIIYTIGSGIFWAIVLFIAARVIFKFGLKRNEAVGL